MNKKLGAMLLDGKTLKECCGFISAEIRFSVQVSHDCVDRSWLQSRDVVVQILDHSEMLPTASRILEVSTLPGRLQPEIGITKWRCYSCNGSTERPGPADLSPMLLPVLIPPLWYRCVVLPRLCRPLTRVDHHRASAGTLRRTSAAMLPM